MRDDSGRYVCRTLAGDGNEHPELSPLLDDFLKLLESIVLPSFAFSRGLIGQDVVRLVHDEMDCTVGWIGYRCLVTVVIMFGE
ncbi:hypothetical protein D9M73_291920 [compost metagenome]